MSGCCCCLGNFASRSASGPYLLYRRCLDFLLDEDKTRYHRIATDTRPGQGSNAADEKMSCDKDSSRERGRKAMRLCTSQSSVWLGNPSRLQFVTRNLVRSRSAQLRGVCCCHCRCGWLVARGCSCSCLGSQDALDDTEWHARYGPCCFHLEIGNVVLSRSIFFLCLCFASSLFELNGLYHTSYAQPGRDYHAK